MFLGVVAPPSGDFDGKVFLRRVSETEQYKKTTHNQNFDDRAMTNTKLKNGEWYAEELGLVKEEGMSLGDLREALPQHYGLNDEVRDRLELKHYRSQTTEGSNPRPYLLISRISPPPPGRCCSWVDIRLLSA